MRFKYPVMIASALLASFAPTVAAAQSSRLASVQVAQSKMRAAPIADDSEDNQLLALGLPFLLLSLVAIAVVAAVVVAADDEQTSP
jgi:hypothetical protein